MKTNKQKIKDNPMTSTDDNRLRPENADETAAAMAAMNQIGEYSAAFCGWLEENAPKEKVQQLERLTKAIESGGATAKCLMERAQLLLSFWKGSEVKGWSRGIIADADLETPFYEGSDILKVVKQDLVSVVLVENGISIFAKWYGDIAVRGDGDTETKALDHIFYRVWAEYFKANPEDPQAHLYRAILLQRMFTRPQDNDFTESDECIRSQADRHFENKSIEEYLYRNNPIKLGTTNLIETIVDADGNSTKWVNGREYISKLKPEWHNHVRNKIKSEIEKASQLSGNDPVIYATGILVWPMPIILELYHLYREGKFKELRGLASAYIDAIEVLPKKYNRVLRNPLHGIQSKPYLLVALLKIFAAFAAFELKKEELDQDYLPCFSDFEKLAKQSWPDYFEFNPAHFVRKALIQMAKECHPAFFARLMMIIHHCQKQTSAKLLVGLDSFWKQFERHQDTGDFSSLDAQNIFPLLKSYPGFAGSLQEALDRDGQDLFEVKLKQSFIDASGLEIGYPFLRAISKQYINCSEQRAAQHAEEKYRTRLEERTQVIAELSHHVKNLLSAVSDPLESLVRQASGVQHIKLEDALKGTRLIERIVQATSLSSAGQEEDFRYDIKNATSDDVGFDFLLEDALKSALAHMFNFQYFERFANAYFPSDESFDAAEKAWESIHVLPLDEQWFREASDIFGIININLGAGSLLKISDHKSSATKLMIVIQELLLNAIKFAAFVDKDKRKIDIDLGIIDGCLTLVIQNTYNPKKATKTVGLGHTFVDKLVGIMGGIKADITDGATYKVSVQFPRYMNEEGK